MKYISRRTYLGDLPVERVCHLLWGSHALCPRAGGQALTLHFLSTFSTIEPEMAHWVTPVCPVLYVLSGDMDLWHAVSPHVACIHLRAPPSSLFI